MSWYAGRPSAASKAVPSADASNVDTKDEPARAPSPSISHDDHVHEDVVVGGWGAGDGEDDFGMM